MAHNPLLGSKISLISKKNIRYEGTLYSINETDATVALQNVKTYGTEGREKNDPACAFYPPQEEILPYLLFRGCDIKDLHVHENSTPVADASPKADTPAETKATPQAASVRETSTSSGVKHEDDDSGNVNVEVKNENDRKASSNMKENDYSDTNTNVKGIADTTSNVTDKGANKRTTGGNTTGRRGRKTNSNNPRQMIGSGASLLHRKARGAVEGVEGPDATLKEDFDFESNLAGFDKNEPILSDEGAHDDIQTNEPATNPSSLLLSHNPSAYSKDDFFDSISCDVLDKQNGIDNRLRGSEERNLNTETFGAASLGHARRGGRGRSAGGRGRGRRGDREYRGRSGGRSYGSRSQNSQSWSRDKGSAKASGEWSRNQ